MIVNMEHLPLQLRQDMGIYQILLEEDLHLLVGIMLELVVQKLLHQQL